MTTPYSNQTWFSDWLSRAWPRTHRLLFNEKWVDALPTIQALGILGAIGVFSVALVKTDKPELYLFYVNDVGHIVLLLAALLLFLPQLGARRSLILRKGSDNVSKTVLRFKNWLHALLILWLLFYACRLSVDGGNVYGWNVADYVPQVSSYINMVSGLALFGMYLSAEYVDTSDWSADGRIWLLVIAIVLVGILQRVADSSGAKSDDPLNLMAGILNGLVVGGATALLIGRLDSRYIGFHKGTTTTLYCYALIQPLYPYIFKKGAAGLQVSMQYAFVAMALIMKSVLLLAAGKILDDGTLHFYIGQMRWLDKHAATLRAQYESARASGGRAQRGGPYLFSLVPPDLSSATIRIDKPDVQIELGILNAWLGVGWDIEKLWAPEIRISETMVPVKELKVRGSEGSVRVPENDKFTLVRIDIDLDVTKEELKEMLKKDPAISQGMRDGQKTKQVDVVLCGLKASMSILDGRESSPIWHRLESVDKRNDLFYSDTLKLDSLR